MLKVGDPAPVFNLPTDGGGTLSSAALAGKPYVLYFYPKDNTTACTAQACDFRDSFARVVAAGGTVLGVSKDSAKSHDTFKKKYNLPFPLLVDEEGTLHAAAGTWGPKKLYGRAYDGTIRSTFLIDGAGVVRAVWSPVKVKGHVDEVLAALAALSA